MEFGLNGKMRAKTNGIRLIRVFIW